jgi:hypothetical protein
MEQAIQQFVTATRSEYLIKARTEKTFLRTVCNLAIDLNGRAREFYHRFFENENWHLHTREQIITTCIEQSKKSFCEFDLQHYAVAGSIYAEMVDYRNTGLHVLLHIETPYHYHTEIHTISAGHFRYESNHTLINNLMGAVYRLPQFTTNNS